MYILMNTYLNQPCHAVGFASNSFATFDHGLIDYYNIKLDK